MLVFVGTDYDGGDQFHVHLAPHAGLRNLQHAIWARQAIPPPSQHLLFESLPLNPALLLHTQGITNFSCIHLYTTCALQAAEGAKRQAAEEDAVARGRFVGPDGKVRLRRRSRRASARKAAVPEVPGFKDLLASLKVRKGVRSVGRPGSSRSSRGPVSVGGGSPCFL